MSDVLGLNEKIRQKFGLFTGLRDQKKDQEILDKVLEVCFQEIMTFMSEKLNENDKARLLDRLSNSNSEEQNEQMVMEVLKSIPDYRFLLESRLDYLIDKLRYE